MPFFPIIPPFRVSRVYNFEDFPHQIGHVTNPQHQQLIYSDPEDGFPQWLTIYTGEIVVGKDDSSFMYPVLGFFNAPGGGTAIGILPINDPPPNQFRSAVGNARIISFGVTEGFTIADVTANVSVSSVAADLFRIELDPRQIINAVVLSGVMSNDLSDTYSVGYRVSVLERLTQNPPPQPPILIGAGWSGRYNLDASGAIGPLVSAGIPQS